MLVEPVVQYFQHKIAFLLLNKCIVRGFYILPESIAEKIMIHCTAWAGGEEEEDIIIN